MSKPGEMVALSPAFFPPVLTGMKVYADDPFRFDFILDKGDGSHVGDGPRAIPLNDDANRLIKYFLASLTVPEKDLWVNLSPYEKDRIVPEAFGRTEMGRDLLAQDYFLKQLTASLMYPEGDLGRKFWAEIYRQAQVKFGTTDIPVDTFNKVWIVPAKAVVFEKKGVVYVVESKLKVMLESDYLAESNNVIGVDHVSSPTVIGGNVAGAGADLVSTRDDVKELIREIILPALEKEVNEGKNFAQLRQVYHSLILATWFKRKVIQSGLWQCYADRNKVAGVNTSDSLESGKIWAKYVEAFKAGAYNFIKEEKDTASGDTVPRKYFSGGLTLRMDKTMSIIHDASGLPSLDNAVVVQTKIDFVDKAQQDLDVSRFLAEELSVNEVYYDSRTDPSLTWEDLRVLVLKNPGKDDIVVTMKKTGGLWNILMHSRHKLSWTFSWVISDNNLPQDPLEIVRGFVKLLQGHVDKAQYSASDLAQSNIKLWQKGDQAQGGPVKEKDEIYPMSWVEAVRELRKVPLKSSQKTFKALLAFGNKAQVLVRWTGLGAVDEFTTYHKHLVQGTVYESMKDSNHDFISITADYTGGQMKNLVIAAPSLLNPREEHTDAMLKFMGFMDPEHKASVYRQALPSGWDVMARGEELARYQDLLRDGVIRAAKLLREAWKYNDENIGKIGTQVSYDHKDDEIAPLDHFADLPLLSDNDKAQRDQPGLISDHQERRKVLQEILFELNAEVSWTLMLRYYGAKPDQDKNILTTKDEGALIDMIKQLGGFIYSEDYKEAIACVRRIKSAWMQINVDLWVPESLWVDIIRKVKAIDRKATRESIIQQAFNVPQATMDKLEAAFVKVSAPDAAQNGGIDLTADKIHVDVRNSSDIFAFKVNPALLRRTMQSAGFMPVIVNILPLSDLQQFLGI
ncbi:MAG: hypothetical protein HQL17_07010 [Candidatus Omnitrophica bacterium]|nr:hypothetical protein [Candidatus Omnitrophota bacterium]